MQQYCVVGMGSIARRHVRNLRALHADAKIVMVSASGINKQCPEGADRVVDLDTALRASPRYAIVASPAPFHTSGAAAFLDAGVPVLIEKPLAAEIGDASTFCAKSQSPAMPTVRVGYCLRFLSTALMVRDILGSGRLGDLLNVSSFVGQYLPDWRPGTDYRQSVSASEALGGGALLELSHELDLLNWFMDGLDVSHSWLRKQMLLALDVEECADLVLTSRTGCHVDLHMDFWQRDTRRHMEFIGSTGRMRWDLMANTVEIAHPGTTPQLLVGTEAQRGDIYIAMLRAFEAQIAGTAQPIDPRLATVEQALLVIRQIDKAKHINAWNPNK